MSVLSISNLHKAFGDVRAVDGVTFAVQEGELYGLLGPNGAGKTTCFYMITGLVTADHGRNRQRGLGCFQVP